MCEAPGELGELTLSATLTQTQTQAFGEFGLKLYTGTLVHSTADEFVKFMFRQF